ncbi:hypothetical protein BaRGS_00014197 [Batillaria attramentaria]|uniref:Uncharacterized protein n=1 Tax=Batillaria attramentaria TaxID=370345 RepID=A0ABD0L697_9CAEN
MAEKTIWLSLNNLCGSQEEVVKELSLLPVEVNENESVKQVTAKVLHLLGLEEKGIVLQLRNNRGSLVPLNGKLQKNTKETPYSLDVLLEYQRVTPKPRSVKVNVRTATIVAQIQNIMQRITMLEESIPELKVKREEKIRHFTHVFDGKEGCMRGGLLHSMNIKHSNAQSELEELDRKLNFLRARFNEADQTTWTGIIKKSPLW